MASGGLDVDGAKAIICVQKKTAKHLASRDYEAAAVKQVQKSTVGWEGSEPADVPLKNLYGKTTSQFPVPLSPKVTGPVALSIFLIALSQLSLSRSVPRFGSHKTTELAVILWMLLALVMFCRRRLAEETLCATTINSNVWVLKAGRENMAEM